MYSNHPMRNSSIRYTLLLHIILLIIPGDNLVLIINSTGQELILEREKEESGLTKS